MEVDKRIDMNLYKKSLIFLVVFLNPVIAFSQQTYLSQHNQSGEKVSKTPAYADVGAFIGCIDYDITYLAVPTEDTEMKKNAEFAVSEMLKFNGDKRTDCFNANGDWVYIYGNGEWLDKVWYFADSNEEYTLFKTGIMKFFVTDTNEPDGFSELGVDNIARSDQRKIILGHGTVKYSVKTESGTIESYWISEDLIRNPASYTKNKFAYVDQIYSVLKGIPLHHEKTVSNFMTTIMKANAIREGEPKDELFKLPAVDLYHW